MITGDVNHISQGLNKYYHDNGNVGDNRVFQKYWRNEADLTNILNRLIVRVICIN